VLAREWLAGTFLNLGSPMTVEIAGLAGFDWVLIDHEHGPGGEDTLLHQLHAASATPAFPVVRIAQNETPRFKRVLDMGALGVMVPYVSTAAETRAAVSAMRYPPHGVRGVEKGHRRNCWRSSAPCSASSTPRRLPGQRRVTNCRPPLSIKRYRN
jgi:4-hydroxy-2-oxoheptanedioate aldolase